MVGSGPSTVNNRDRCHTHAEYQHINSVDLPIRPRAEYLRNNVGAIVVIGKYVRSRGEGADMHPEVHLDSSLSAAERASALLARMTLRRKAHRLPSVPAWWIVTADGIVSRASTERLRG